MKTKHYALLSASLFIMSPLSAQAGVTWMASDTINGLLLTTSGSMNLVPADVYFLDNTSPAWTETSSAVMAFLPMETVNRAHFSGATGGGDPWILGTLSPDTVTGDAFGFSSNHQLIMDVDFGLAPTSFTPHTTMLFNGQTIATAFGSNLDAGPVTLWTGGGDTVSVALQAVPEPASSLLMIMGASVCLLRRKR